MDATINRGGAGREEKLWVLLWLLAFFGTKSKVSCSLFLGGSSGALALEGGRRFLVRFLFCFPFFIQISHSCSSSVVTVLVFTAASTAEGRRYCALGTRLQRGLRGEGVFFLIVMFCIQPCSRHCARPPSRLRSSSGNCKPMVRGCGTDKVQSQLWLAYLLLRREPLRLCSLLLGWDHLRQAGILLRSNQLRSFPVEWPTTCSSRGTVSI